MRRVFWYILVACWAALIAAPVTVCFVPVTVQGHQYRLPEILPGLAAALSAVVGLLALSRRAWWSAPASLPRALLAGMAAPLPAAALLCASGVAQVTDFGAYCAAGRALAHGGWGHLVSMEAFRPPGMALFLAAPAAAGLSDSWMALAANGVAFAGGLLAMAWMFRGVMLPRWLCAAVAGGILLAAPPLLVIAASEGPAFALQLVLVLLIPAAGRRIDARGPGTLLLAGAVLGLAVTFRSVLVIQLPILMLAVALARWRRKEVLGGSWRAAVVLLGFAVILAPFAARNYAKYGRFVLLSYNGGEIFYASNVSPSLADQGRENDNLMYELRAKEPDPLLRDAMGYRLGLRAIAAHPGTFAASIPYRFAQMLGRTTLWPASYIGQFSSGPLLAGSSALALTAGMMVAGTFLLLLAPWALRRQLRGWLIGRGAGGWVLWSFIAVAAAQIMFQCAGRYVITLAAYPIALAAAALARPAEPLAPQ